MSEHYAGEVSFLFFLPFLYPVDFADEDRRCSFFFVFFSL